MHMLKKFEELKLKNLGDYHDLYVQSDTLLLVDVFENFRNKCIEIWTWRCSFFVCTRISMASLFKKTEVELELLMNIYMLLMAENGIRGGICQTIHRYAKANNKYMKNFDKDIESYLVYLDASNLYGWAMSQKLPVNGFKWAEELSEFDERFIKNYDEYINKEYFLEVDIEYSKKFV